jgi:two-component system sensor kinase FixL
MQSKHKSTPLLGIFGLLSLITVIGMLGLHSLQSDDFTRSEAKLAEYELQLTQLSKMIHAARERSLLILRMSYESDVFEREHLSDLFSDQAQLFINSLENLRDSDLEPDHIKHLDKTLERISATSTLLIEALQLMQDKFTEEAVELVLSAILPSQDIIIRRLELLQEMIGQSSANQLKHGRELTEKHRNHFLLIVFWITLLISGGLFLLHSKFRQDQQQLDNTRKMNESILDNAFDAIIILDRSCRITRVNNACKKLLGYEENQLLGRSINQLSADPMFNSDQACPSPLGMGSRETRLIQSTNQLIPVALSLSETGISETYHFTCIIHDLTQIHEARAALVSHQEKLEETIEQRTHDLRLAKEHAEAANKSKSLFLANMSHELRTPMHAISSFANLGIKAVQNNTPEKIDGFMSRILDSAARLTRVLNDLLDLSKMEAGKMEYRMQPNDFTVTVSKITRELETLAASRNQHIKLTKPGNECRAVYDNGRITQVIHNLLSNALKFSGEGKTIDLAYQLLEDASYFYARIPAPLTESSNYIHLSICDEGPGIPDNELESIFEHFVQSSTTATGAGGTGLGLAICREIISQHNGVIFAENNPDNGVTFHFVIPCEKTELDAA